MTETEASLDLEYHYDEGIANTGRIMQISDHNDPSRSVSFDYDEFGRLVAAETAGSHWGLAWNYDPYGNQLSQSLTKGTGPTRSVSVDANTNRINGFSYDAAGNMLTDGTKTYAYNAENQVTELTGGIDGRDGDYKYDAMGGRVARISAGVTTLYFFGTGEFQVGSGWQKLFVFLGREKLVEYSANRTWFFHSDHLGTPRVKTNLSGGAAETWDSYPFGEAWGATATPDQHRYTGHLRDSESENDYAGARYYASLHARWLSVDPALGDLANPQRLNRYSYVLNDPVNYIDPDGREPVPQGAIYGGRSYYHGPSTSSPSEGTGMAGPPAGSSYYLPGGAGPSIYLLYHAAELLPEGSESLFQEGTGFLAGLPIFLELFKLRNAIAPFFREKLSEACANLFKDFIQAARQDASLLSEGQLTTLEVAASMIPTIRINRGALSEVNHVSNSAAFTLFNLIAIRSDHYNQSTLFHEFFHVGQYFSALANAANLLLENLPGPGGSGPLEEEAVSARDSFARWADEQGRNCIK